ncbi:MAG: hypothetical protein LBO09_02035 [Candidatus Peribacteria bacterium]|jgi:hypothetical protein|nr:hypothetical protein [Candidatus Peribacteria bacterium]
MPEIHNIAEIFDEQSLSERVDYEVDKRKYLYGETTKRADEQIDSVIASAKSKIIWSFRNLYRSRIASLLNPSKQDEKRKLFNLQVLKLVWREIPQRITTILSIAKPKESQEHEEKQKAWELEILSHCDDIEHPVCDCEFC